MRLRKIALGVSTIAIATTTAGAVAPAGAAEPVTIAVSGNASKLDYGRSVKLRGKAGADAPNKPVAIQFAPRGEGFTSIGTAKTGADGIYVYHARAKHSGAYRAVVEGRNPSAAQRVTVLARLSVKASEHLKRGETATVSGEVKPGLKGRSIVVQTARGGSWKTAAKAITGKGGRYSASWKLSRGGSYRVRVRFGGDAANAGSTKTFPGRVNVYTPGGASWYGGGGGTACGTHAKYGVAHKSLPCGTKVRMMYNGRTATATVVDRGPFVGGRAWDLTPALKRKLGFGDVGTVWAAY